MLDNSFDVIIVGGGPSGSMTGYRLAKAGVRVGILDAKKFPRDKGCGGGVQEKAAQKIPFDWSSVKRGSLQGLAFSFKLDDRFSRRYPLPLVHSVLRIEFDELLLRQAEAAGARIFENVKATDVSDMGNHAVVSTECGSFSAKVVVGADGANGISKRSLNSRRDYYWQSGLYCEVPQDLLLLDAIEYDCMRVDWGTLPSGYAWMFPKRGFVNIGVGFPNSIGRMARPYLSKFLETERIVRPEFLNKVAFKGHQLPTLTDTTALSKGRILLVGDAAGLIEPFTGDGISYALHSAEIAAEVIINALNTADFDLSAYEQRARAEIACELVWSRKLLSFFVAFPRMIHEVFKRNDKVWGAFCRVLRGEDSFRVFRRKKFGALEFMWAPVDAFVERYERRKLRSPNEEEGAFVRTTGRLVGSFLRKV
ncbi:MAG: geranylgeranyl reductase family protein [Bryobacteraceae bacterium]